MRRHLLHLPPTAALSGPPCPGNRGHTTSGPWVRAPPRSVDSHLSARHGCTARSSPSHDLLDYRFGGRRVGNGARCRSGRRPSLWPQDAVPGPFGRTNPWWVRPTPRALGWLPGVRRLAFGRGMRWVRGRWGQVRSGWAVSGLSGWAPPLAVHGRRSERGCRRYAELHPRKSAPAPSSPSRPWSNAPPSLFPAVVHPAWAA